MPPGFRRAPRTSRRALTAALLASLLSFGLPALVRIASARDLAVDLSMRYISQYLGNPNDRYDCGPASMAMVLDAYGLRPAGASDASFVASIRRTSGAASGLGTTYDQLARVAQAYGLHYAYVPSALPGEPATEAQIMQQAIDAGNLVIAMVHGADLGRGDQYEDHWLVVTGFSADAVHVFDPDDQAPRWSGWIRGGDIRLSLSTFESAGLHAQPGPYAMIVYAPGNHAPLQAGQAAHIAGTNGDGAWLRSSPGIADNKLALLPEGTPLMVIGPFPAPNTDGHDWIGVNVNGQQGYVAAEYVQGE